MTPARMAEIHQKAVLTGRPWSQSEFQSLIDNQFAQISVTEHCFVLGRLVAGEAEILMVATDPEFQNQGHATRALSAFIAQLIEKRAERVFLEVSQNNQSAIRLYTKLGFAQISTRTAYYDGPNGTKYDALILEKALLG